MKSEIDINTVNEDVNKMRVASSQHSAKKDGSFVNDLVEAVETLLNDDNIELKSRRSMPQVWGSTEICTVNNSSKLNFGLCNRVSAFLDKDLEKKLVSINGLGRLEAIEMTKNIKESVEEENKLKVINKGTTIR